MLFHVKTLDELSEAISKANQQDQTKIVVDTDIRIGGIDNVKQSRFEYITASMEIDGGGHKLQGEGIGIGLVIKNSNVKISNLTIAGFSFGLWVDPEEQKPLDDIELRDCVFQDMAQVGVVVGSDNSNTGVDGMLIENCVFDTALSDRKETPQTGTRFVMMLGCSILTGSGKDIRNNFLKNITVRNCKTIGSQARKFDGGMFVVGSYDLGYAFLNQEEIAQYMMTKRSTAYDTEIENVIIEGCEFNDTSDAMLIFTGICSGAQAENFSLKNCAVLNNVFNFDSNAVSLVAADHFGTGDAGGFSQNMAIQNVKISGNTMIKRGDFFDTNCAGVILFTILHESGICRSFHDSIRHIEITGNRIENADYGIECEALHAYWDETYKSTGKDIVLEDIKVEANEILNTTIPLYFAGARLEGRLGKWALHSPVPDNPEFPHSIKAEDCLARNIHVSSNKAERYWVYAMSVGGEVAGRGRCENCRTENIIVEKPELDYGRQLERKEFYRADEILIENGSGINNHAELVFIK